MIRLIQVGLGPLGRLLLQDFVAGGHGRVLGAVDPDPALAGRPLAEFVEDAPADLSIATSLEELSESGAFAQADAALVTTFSDLERSMDSFRFLLDAGIDVVSSCEELLYPWLRHPVLAQELHERGLRAGARIVGSGINPGFLMDTLPLVASAVCRRIDRVAIERVQDAAPRRLPFQRKIGAGLALADFERGVSEGHLRHVGLGESLHFLGHYLGWQVERWEETIEPVIAERELECALGPIAAGRASGVRQQATGWVRGEPRLSLLFQAAIGQPEPADRVRIEGEPDLDLCIRGGVQGDIGTCSMLLHTLHALRAAEPGLHTMATIRPPRWQAR